MLSLLLVEIGVTEGRSQSNGEQIDSLLISGVIWDAETFQPIPYANVYTGKLSAFSNISGEYTILIYPGDSLKVSHVGYEGQKILVSSSNQFHFFWLKPYINELNEVIILPLPTEGEMKQFMLDAKPVSSPEVYISQDGRSNLQNIRTMYLKGYRPAMNSLDNYLNYMKGPQGVSIFSTSPSRGISGVIRNIKRK